MKPRARTTGELRNGVPTYQSSDRLGDSCADMDQVSNFPPKQDVHRVYVRNHGRAEARWTLSRVG